MGKYLLPAIFILFLALNLAAYAFITFELDGSTVKIDEGDGGLVIKAG